MEGEAKRKETRRRYQRPQVKQVELRPQEAVLQVCKTAGWVDGPKANDCLGEVGFCLVVGT
jgi:hypothetical protein